MLVSCLVALLTSCGNEVCTLVGCNNGLLVNVGSAPASPFRVEAYVYSYARYGQTCSGTPCHVFFPEFTPEFVRIDLIAGADTVSRQFYPTYVLNRPNGPNCDPECREATVTFWVVGVAAV
jgi:hypothetical protein